MRKITTIEIFAIAKELQSLKNFYFDKFYEIEEGKFRFKLTKKGEKVDLLCILLHTINTTKFIEQGARESNFYLAVRKRIKGYKIEDIKQLNEDRILQITASKHENEIKIIFEMFDKGNLIITDKNMQIILAYRQRKFRDREIRPGKYYSVPTNSSILLSKIGNDSDSVKQLIKNNKNNPNKIIAILSRNINIGVLYIEDVLLRSGIDPKSQITALSAEQTQRLLENMLNLKKYAEFPNSRIYKRNGEIIDYAICSIKKYESLDFEVEKFDSLNEALDMFYHEVEINKPEESLKARQVKGIEISIEKQKALLEGIDKNIEKLKIKGETIFKNLTTINSVISVLRERKRITKEELQSIFPEIKIVKLNLKEKTITIELSD